VSIHPYSALHHLCWGILLNHDPKRTWVAVMSEYAVYLDDSGHPDDQPYVVVAGFAATEEQWLGFEEAWRAALKRNVLGSVFHMVEFESGPKTKAKGKILEDLTATINSHVQGAFSVFVDMQAYRKVNQTIPLEECLGKPYALAARGVARGINSWKQLFFKRGDHLLVFVEEGTKHKGDMEEVFRRDAIPIPQTVPKKHPAAQAADMLAWEVFHFARYGNYRRSLVNLLKDKLHCEEMEGAFHERNLVETCNRAGIPCRSLVPQNYKFVYHSLPDRIRKRDIK
jgi:hypothetical protein